MKRIIGVCVVAFHSGGREPMITSFINLETFYIKILSLSVQYKNMSSVISNIYNMFMCTVLTGDTLQNFDIQPFF